MLIDTRFQYKTNYISVNLCAPLIGAFPLSYHNQRIVECGFPETSGFSNQKPLPTYITQFHPFNKHIFKVLLIKWTVNCHHICCLAAQIFALRAQSKASLLTCLWMSSVWLEAAAIVLFALLTQTHWMRLLGAPWTRNRYRL